MGSSPSPDCLEPPQGSLVFALNGNRVELHHVDPSMTLLAFLRNEAALTGTKLGCGEGGCGACVVLVSKHNASRGESEDFTVNSCLAPLCSLHGCAVTTIEGLGNSRDGLHSIQKRFAGFHGSQCGFCTPGMCMSLYGALRSQSRPTQTVDLEKSIAANLCRCTGYRPISDICKSFSSDVDLEDLGINSYWKLGDTPDRNLLPGYNPGLEGSRFPDFLDRQDHSLVALGSTKKWIRPGGLEEVFTMLERYQDTARLVAGNTSTGIYKDDLQSSPEVFIEIGAVPELLEEKVIEDGIEVGAAVKISKLIALLEASGRSDSSGVYLKLAEHMRKVATLHVRNAGSVGGNLILAQKLGFDSDIATILVGAGASVKVVTQKFGESRQSVEDFVAATWDGKSILKSICIPSYSKQDNVRFDSYRASPRPLGNAVAYVNAAFLVNLSGDGRVCESRLAFGAFGGEPTCQRATEVERFLEGKVVDGGVMLEAIQLAKVCIVPKKGTSKADYRSSLVASFLFKFLSSLAAPSSSIVPELPYVTQAQNGSTPRSSRKIMSGRQTLQEHLQGAVGQPMSKVMGELQASGEAIYVDDIPAPRDCVHAVYVYSTKALAKINGIRLENALASPGALSFVGVDDIPSGGQNMGLVSDLSQEKLFAEDKVECVGHAVGLMIADTLRNAKAAAGKVVIDYDTESVGSPVLTMEEAVARGELHETPQFFKAMMKDKHGNVAEEMAKASLKIENAEVGTGSQYYFYMEPQTALVVPDEDNCLVVYSSCQSPDFVQHSVSACLGLPMHNVRVITRRVGGGFGGKGTKACLVASACALAAYKLRRPVRLTLDRNTDMIMMGGRHPMKAVYDVGFEPDGKINALHAKIFIQGGWSPEFTPVMPMGVLSALKKLNWGAFSFEFVLCRTNIPSRTVMRAPGDVQGCFFADAVVEHVAALTNLSSELVMERNLHSVESAGAAYGAAAVGGEEGYTLPAVWSRLKDRAKVDERLRGVERYNAANAWKKRGVAVSQSTYTVQQRYQPGRVSIMADGSVVVETGGVEIGQGLWTKVRQAAASALGEGLGGGICVDVGRVRVVQADTISMPHGGWTGGSTTSEASCEAVRKACRVLVDRFKPIHEKRMAECRDGETVSSWESLVLAAKNARVEMAAQTAFVSSPEALTYINYGAAASEVEIDVLTGEYEILQTDIVYDCGKSINPAVDIGQIEGAFAQGVGFFTSEEHRHDEQGKLINDGTWTYKPPTLDNLPRHLNVELLNSKVHEHRILSSKASGEPPLLLASSVHGALRHAIAAARKNLRDPEPYFQLDAPATIDKVRMLCGVENIELYLKA
ncbi:probable aldehyde oxidase 1 [Selaginella moellendorffii]|uniref:probable aldehyde oxidase 1 n=1 Tax=Selaginella moellendorffii TaxID=88036 RepID=UPI000D1D0A92|nr:probable aldehyde oxidase 1 [Selaginella moellendorffii]|eukprot:XP_024538449.1 probable aldehyde oxidase 1 [Selaginella moellendorffii]